MSGDPSTPGSSERHDVGDQITEAEVVSLLQQLVRIESPYFREEAITEFVHGWLSERDLDPEYHEVSETEFTGYRGQNVLARQPGHDAEAPCLLVNAHMDTVEIVDGWTADPLSGRLEDGRVYGQGAADMKAGLAAAMVAFATLAEADLAGELLFTAVVDEEGPFGLGTDQLIQDGVLDDCDMAIVTEPGPPLAQNAETNPALFLGARGRFMYDIEVFGAAAHGSAPDRGSNAVIDAGRVAEALSTMSVGQDPKLGAGSVCPLSIEGGDETLSVPEYCRLKVDRHVVRGETAEDVLAEARAVVDDLDLESRVEIGLRALPHPEARYRAYTVPEDHALVDGLATATEAVTGSRPTYGYFRSVGDFNFLGDRAGLPTVIVGPDGGNIHGAGEWVDVAETVETARIVAAGATELLGG